MSKESSAVPAKITTVDRILDASLKLFNEQGFHRVPALCIAETLGISPGHLAYHFKNKSELIAALLPRLERSLEDVIHLDLPHVAPSSIDKVLNILRALWNHRFFFLELPQLVQDDLPLLNSCIKLEDRMLTMIEASYQRRITEGVMEPIPEPNSPRLMAKCVWRSWVDWVRAEQIVHPGQPMPSRASVYEAMMVGYCLIQPYLSPGYLDEVVVALKARLADPILDAASSMEPVQLPS